LKYGTAANKPINGSDTVSSTVYGDCISMYNLTISLIIDSGVSIFRRCSASWGVEAMVQIAEESNFLKKSQLFWATSG
jgi:hypothetical protein